MKKLRNFIRDDKGDAVIEAAILFPVIVMIFAALVLLAVYLPTRALLQQATQYAATAIATERSDTWLRHDADDMEYYFEDDKKSLGSVYGAVLGGLTGNNRDDVNNADKMVNNILEGGVMKLSEDAEVSFGVVNLVVYKEIIVTATCDIPMPVDLSFVGFPTELPITVTSTAVVQNGDEFIRNMDIAADLTGYLAEKYNLDDTFSGVKKFLDKFKELVGL